jgi:hypothetical protein
MFVLRLSSIVVNSKIYFLQSLSSSFSSLDSELYSASILRHAHFTSLKLINLLYPALPSPLPVPLPSYFAKRSESRFDALSLLFKEGVIHVWEFKGGSVNIESILLATLLDGGLLKVLAPAGIIRYLQILLPHLTSLISFTVPSVDTVEMFVKGVRAIGVILEIIKGRGRVERWRGMILTAVAKCWTNLREENDGIKCGLEALEETSSLEGALKEVVKLLEEESEMVKNVGTFLLYQFILPRRLIRLCYTNRSNYRG